MTNKLINKLINILMIDDNRYDFELIEEYLSEAEDDIIITHASTYDKGMAQISNKKFDLYLLDYKLNMDDGLLFLKELREKKNTIPVIMLSGWGNKDTDIMAMKLGADDYLDKETITPELLERSIRYTLEKHSSFRKILQINLLLKTAIKKQQFLDTVFENMAAHLNTYNMLEKKLEKKDFYDDVFKNIADHIKAYNAFKSFFGKKNSRCFKVSTMFW
jgi:DNA-binding response OmpR family regulator